MSHLSEVTPRVDLSHHLQPTLVTHNGSAGRTIFDFFKGRSFHRVFAILTMGGTVFIGLTLFRRYKYGLYPFHQRTNILSITEGVPMLMAPEVKRNDNQDKVILSQCPRGLITPCIAPFSMKLETYLRVARIPYEIEFFEQPQSQNSPWLIVGGEGITESHECIKKLKEYYEVDLEKDATASRISASRMINTVLDTRINWAISLWRWVHDEGKSLDKIQPAPLNGAKAVIESVKSTVQTNAYYNGLGRLPEEDVILRIREDLHDISAALGRHKFFLGDKPGEADCNAFAMLSQLMWNMPGSPYETEIKKHRNLVEFVARMKELYWPDWDQLLSVPNSPEDFKSDEVTSTDSKTSISEVTTKSESDALPISSRQEKDSTPIASTSPSSNIVQPAKNLFAQRSPSTVSDGQLQRLEGNQIFQNEVQPRKAQHSNSYFSAVRNGIHSVTKGANLQSQMNVQSNNPSNTNSVNVGGQMRNNPYNYRGLGNNNVLPSNTTVSAIPTALPSTTVSAVPTQNFGPNIDQLQLAEFQKYVQQAQGVEWPMPHHLGSSAPNMGAYNPQTNLGQVNPRMNHHPMQSYPQSVVQIPQQFYTNSDARIPQQQLANNVAPGFPPQQQPLTRPQSQPPQVYSNDQFYQQQQYGKIPLNYSNSNVGTTNNAPQKQKEPPYVLDKRVIAAIQEEDLQTQTIDAVNRTLSNWEKSQYEKIHGFSPDQFDVEKQQEYTINMTNMNTDDGMQTVQQNNAPKIPRGFYCDGFKKA